LIDQHAAHERVLYEQFLKEMRNQSIFSQRLLSPMVLELSVSDVHYAIENINFIKNLGYEVEEFGNNSLIVKGVPSFLELTEAKLFLDEIIENISGQSLHKNRTEKIISRACKKAVKANDHLNHQEMLHLLKALSLTENPYSCPHGRPVIIKLNESDIDKMFKRT
jgi:DNA mismatch repair protein MutL